MRTLQQLLRKTPCPPADLDLTAPLYLSTDDAAIMNTVLPIKSLTADALNDTAKAALTLSHYIFFSALRFPNIHLSSYRFRAALPRLQIQILASEVTVTNGESSPLEMTAPLLSATTLALDLRRMCV